MFRTWSALVATLALAACTGAPPAAEGTATPPKADNADKVEAVVKKVEPSQAGASDDGWTAPASTRDPKACAGAEPPVPVDPNTIEPLALPETANAALKDPKLATKTAPDVFKVKFETTEGDFVVEAHRDWSPNGVDRFYNLVDIGYFDQVRFFRNIEGFMVQFGISGYPEVNALWSESRIPDDPVVQGNKRGTITFAKCGAPNCRSTQLFINHKDNTMLDPQGFSAFGRVVQGMDVVDKLYDCYGEGYPRGRGPRQDLAQQLGNAYLDAGFPNFDHIKSASFVE